MLFEVVWDGSQTSLKTAAELAKFESRVVLDGSQTALEPLQSPSTAPSATLAFALVLSLIGVPEHPGVTPGP